MKRLIPLFALTLLLGACTVFTYVSPSGETTKLVRFGYDTKVGKITAYASSATQPARLDIEDVTSEAKAVDTAGKVIDLASKLVK